MIYLILVLINAIALYMSDKIYNSFTELGFKRDDILFMLLVSPIIDIMLLIILINGIVSEKRVVKRLSQKILKLLNR